MCSDGEREREREREKKKEKEREREREIVELEARVCLEAWNSIDRCSTVLLTPTAE